MKILISTLLLTILVFVDFGELNATDPEEGSSAKRGQKRQRSRVIQPTEPDPNDGPADRTVRYGETEIQVWLDRSSRVRRAVYERNYIPQGAYYTFKKFLIRSMDIGGLRFVAFMNEKGDLLGLRGPRRTGQQMVLEPTGSMWYINYCAIHLAVVVRNSAPISINLMPVNLHIPAEHISELVTVAGITFKLFRGPNTNITGAEFVSSIYEQTTNV